MSLCDNLTDFIAESRGFLDEIESTLLRMEQDNEKQQYLGTISRKVYDLKKTVDTIRLDEILAESDINSFISSKDELQNKTSTTKDIINHQNSVRVDAEKLDQLINVIGELVIASAGSVLEARSSENNSLSESFSVVTDLVEDVRDIALALRTVQIGDTFNYLQHAIQDIIKSLNKQIDIKIHGAETELDKTLVEKISDPLRQLARYAIANSIEDAEIRRQRGKSTKGTLKLNAFHDSGSIVIEVSDDGEGLDRDLILQLATQRELVQTGSYMEDQEIFNLIFESGFSIKESTDQHIEPDFSLVTVKQLIEALQGTIEVESQPGRGSAFRIRIPLTLAIIDGFLVEVNNSSYVVPLDLVHECVEMKRTDTSVNKDQHYLNLRGEVLPIVRLREIFASGSQAPLHENIVVVQYGDKKAGLVVDTLLGEFQTVIKPLGKIFNQLNGIGGSTILGNGQVALIIDVPGLLQQVSHLENQAVGTAA